MPPRPKTHLEGGPAQGRAPPAASRVMPDHGPRKQSSESLSLQEAAWQGAPARGAILGPSLEVEKQSIFAVDAAGRTPLMHLAGEGDAPAVKSQILQGAAVNATDECKCTALMYAATYGHFDAVRCLIEHGAEVEAKSRDGWTPLITAAYNGHLKVVRCLLEHGANVEAADERGWTSLMHVAFSGDNDTLRQLLEFQARVDSLDSDGRDAVVYAAFNGHLANVSSLLAAGNNRRGQQNESVRDTAFLFAAIRGHVEVLHLLVQEGRYAPTPEARHAAQKLAADHGHDSVVVLLGRVAAGDGMPAPPDGRGPEQDPLEDQVMDGQN